MCPHRLRVSESLDAQCLLRNIIMPPPQFRILEHSICICMAATVNNLTENSIYRSLLTFRLLSSVYLVLFVANEIT